ncbi:hypothetical protein JCM1840_003605 [Sporobolomyces johnsonii]
MKRRRLSPFVPYFLISPFFHLLALPSPVRADTDRTFTIKNNCNYALWPAVTNYGANSGYTGSRGWEAAAGNSTTITIPSPWNGRIWARRDCTFDSSGSGSCVTGNCDGGLECDDQTIGYVNVGEFNLDSWGGNDFWDISCVPGWTVTMSIEPDGCDSVVCATDLNPDCPDDKMKQTDSDGNVIGCLSACMAGINAETPSMNCCSGDLNNLTTCVSSGVDYYSVLKPYCPHAYWYPYDSRPNYPEVDYACSAAKNPSYTVTFCPTGSTTGGNNTTNSTSSSTGGGGSSSGTTGYAKPTVTASSGMGASSTTGSGEGGSSGITGGITKSSTGSGSAASSSSSLSTGLGSESESSSSADSSSSSSTADSSSSSSISSDDVSTILGLPRTTFFLALAAIGVLLLGR